MKKILFLLFFVLAQTWVVAQNKPRLVVGIVVDQMRQEYLYRFEKKFSEGGFKRLISNGFMMTNAHYNYVPAVTGPGHASIFTGSTPAVHGIINNEWWDKKLKKNVNCVEDPAQKPVGVEVGKGAVSPWRMLSTTVTDELKVFTQKKSKVIGVSIKDRGAVLPAGHLADAAYWLDNASGKFITSTFYLTKLPDWVEKFNSLKRSDFYLNKDWNTLLPAAEYAESDPDDSPYEKIWKGRDKATFPFELGKLKTANGGYDLLAHTAFGDDLLTEFALAALEGENLGKGSETDFLTVSFSSPDLVGHAMGPNSVEIEDTYLRLDKNIETFLTKLDQTIGKENYMVFLTADHAVVDVPQSLIDSKIPAGYFSVGKKLKDELDSVVSKSFVGRTMIEAVSGRQVFFNTDAFSTDPKNAGIELLIATELVANYLQAKPGVAQVFTKAILKQSSYTEGGIKGKVVRGYNMKRCGDIVFELEPGWLESTFFDITGQPERKGTSHGTAYTYDSHVPMLFYGKGIRKGSSAVYHDITDLAPTISVLLKIKFPSGCTGNPITEIVDGK